MSVGGYFILFFHPEIQWIKKKTRNCMHSYLGVRFYCARQRTAYLIYRDKRKFHTMYACALYVVGFTWTHNTDDSDTMFFFFFWDSLKTLMRPNIVAISRNSDEHEMKYMLFAAENHATFILQSARLHCVSRYCRHIFEKFDFFVEIVLSIEAQRLPNDRHMTLLRRTLCISLY